ncbi:glutathione S-transferase family protein [Microbulbifer sp. CAU 1566]|uniref:glutathione S-transferase family protein n=1 Tax=Microbulbifer sp. CAU 1566 TaxID=2933269 RepID=UPI002006C585|nr:glutathione S-transferase family protein [Microbulbifer sp. CAU 1566]MCK7596341.1 glutathione S-transferase family protein [Microbulbifer sp. CAU 1566]
MYKLYYMPGACSRAIHALILDLDQPVELIARDSVEDFRSINPTNQVPVLVDGDLVLREGAAIVLYLLNKHAPESLGASAAQQAEFTQWLMFANATLHPAYGLLFFASRGLESDAAKEEVLQKAAARINGLWQLVEQRLADRPVICGEKVSAIDMMLAVYANWSNYFPLEISLGKNTRQLFEKVVEYPAFAKAVAAEEAVAA